MELKPIFQRVIGLHVKMASSGHKTVSIVATRFLDYHIIYYV